MDGDDESAASIGDIRENSAAAQLVRRLRAVAPQAPQGTHYSNAYWYRVLSGYRFPEWQAVEEFVTGHGQEPKELYTLWQRARIEGSQPLPRNLTEDGYSDVDASGRFIAQSGLTSDSRPKGRSFKPDFLGAVILGLAVPIVAATASVSLRLTSIAVGFTLLVGLTALLLAIRSRKRSITSTDQDSASSIPYELYDLYGEEAQPFKVEGLFGDYWVQLPTELFARGPTRLVLLLGWLGFLGGGAATIGAVVQGGTSALWSAITWVLGAASMGVGLWMLRERSLVLGAITRLRDALSDVPDGSGEDVYGVSGRLNRIAREQALALRRSRDDSVADMLIAWTARQFVR